MKNYLTLFAFCLAGITAFGQEHRSAPVTGVNEETVLVYPNPAVSSVTIKTAESLTDAEYHVKIYNLQGTVVEESVVRGGGALVVDIDHLEDGVYIVAIVDDNDYGRGSGRLIKRR